MRTTFAQVKASRIPAVLGLCSTDSRLAAYVNEAQQRLLIRGKTHGTYQAYKICVNDGCITWPRQIAAIEAVAVCTNPIPIRNEWFEYLVNGTGLQKQDDGILKLIDRGNAVTFEDINGVDSLIRVYPVFTVDVGKVIRFFGYDENGTWIKTLEGGVYVDGEKLTIAAPYVESTKKFAMVTGVIKDETKGNLNVVAYDISAALETTIAIYEPDETTPQYRRSLIVGLENMNACPDAANDCDKKAVTVMAKLDHIPVANDTDFMIVSNIPALKLACIAIKKEENNLFSDAEKYMEMAITELEKEQQHYTGDGDIVQVRTEDKWTFGAGSVENPV